MLNKTVRIRRRSAPDFSGAETLYAVHSSARARVVFRRRTAITSDGVEVATDADMRIDSMYDLQQNDVIEILPDVTVKYRVESIDEVINAAGRVVALKASLAKAENL